MVISSQEDAGEWEEEDGEYDEETGINAAQEAQGSIASRTDRWWGKPGKSGMWLGTGSEQQHLPTSFARHRRLCCRQVFPLSIYTASVIQPGRSPLRH